MISVNLTHDQINVLILNPLRLHIVILLLLWDRGRVSHCTHIRHLKNTLVRWFPKLSEKLNHIWDLRHHISTTDLVCGFHLCLNTNI